MTMRLYPRLRTFEAKPLIERLVGAPLEELEVEQEVLPRGLVWAATGGNRVSAQDLTQLRRALRVAAEGAGYRYGATRLGTASRADRLRLDRTIARVLFSRMQMTPNEASHGEAWRYIACVIAPELVRWRFAGEEATSADRFGPNIRRNMFARLWWRALTFYDSTLSDPWWLFDALGEDEMVQVTERPKAAGYGPLARSIARSLLQVHDPAVHPNRSDILRDTMKRLMRRLPLLRYELLDSSELDAALGELFADTFTAKGLEPSRQIALPTPPSATVPEQVEEVSDDEPTEEVVPSVASVSGDAETGESDSEGIDDEDAVEPVMREGLFPQRLSRAARALFAVLEGEWLAKSDLLERCSVNEAIWLPTIQELVAAGLAEQTGERRGRRYRRRPGARLPPASDAEEDEGPAPSGDPVKQALVRMDPTLSCHPCPGCRATMVLFVGRRGPFLKCRDRACGRTIMLPPDTLGRVLSANPGWRCGACGNSLIVQPRVGRSWLACANGHSESWKELRDRVVGRPIEAEALARPPVAATSSNLGGLIGRAVSIRGLYRPVPSPVTGVLEGHVALWVDGVDVLLGREPRDIREIEANAGEYVRVRGVVDMIVCGNEGPQLMLVVSPKAKPVRVSAEPDVA